MEDLGELPVGGGAWPAGKVAVLGEQGLVELPSRDHNEKPVPPQMPASGVELVTADLFTHELFLPTVQSDMGYIPGDGLAGRSTAPPGLGLRTQQRYGPAIVSSLHFPIQLCVELQKQYYVILEKKKKKSSILLTRTSLTLRLAVSCSFMVLKKILKEY